MISVTAEPFLRAERTNGVEVAGRGILIEMAAQGFQLAVWRCSGQVAGAVTGVDADDEHREYGGYRAGQERGDDEQDDGGGRANSRSLSVIQVTLSSHELECPDLVAADPFRGFLDGVHVFHAE